MWVRFLGWDDPLEKGMATHSSMPTQRIPWTEEPGIRGYGSQGPKELIMTEATQPACMPLTLSHKYCNTYEGRELVIKKLSAKIQRGWDIDGYEIIWFQFSIFTQQLLASKLAILIIFSQETQGRVKSSSLLFVLLHSQVRQKFLPKSPKILHLYKVLFSAKLFKFTGFFFFFSTYILVINCSYSSSLDGESIKILLFFLTLWLLIPIEMLN